MHDVFYVPSAHRSPHADLLHFNSRRTLLRSEATYPSLPDAGPLPETDQFTWESQEPQGSDGKMGEPLVEKRLRTDSANRQTFIITIRKPTVRCSHNTGAGGGQQRRSRRGAPPPHRGRRRVLGRLFSVLTHSCETTSTKLPWVSVKVEQRWAQNFSYERFSDNI